MFTSHSETEPEAILLGQNTSAEMVDKFKNYWCHEDIWAAEARRRGKMKRGVVLIGSELVPNDQLHRSRYYNEFARHYRMDGMLGSVLFDGTEGDDIPFTNLCWYRPPGCGDFELDHKRQLMGLLAHFQQALKIQYKLKALHTQALLDGGHSRTVSVLLDANGRIIDTNTLADVALKAGNGLLRCSNNCLRTLGKRSAPAFEDALAACRASRRPVHLLVQTAEPGVLLRGVLLPLPVEEESYIGWQDDRHFLLMVDLPREDIKEVIARAAELFGLSGAERRLAAMLVEGLSLEQISEMRNISLNTVRSQVRGLLSKTGFTRQIDLVRVLSRLMG
jgi:DNA-binding CsgD family transcriptional regulator